MAEKDVAGQVAIDDLGGNLVVEFDDDDVGRDVVQALKNLDVVRIDVERQHADAVGEIRALDDFVDRVRADGRDHRLDGGDTGIAGGEVVDHLHAERFGLDQKSAPTLLRPQRVRVRQGDAVAGADFETCFGRVGQEFEKARDNAVFPALRRDVAAVVVEPVVPVVLG